MKLKIVTPERIVFEETVDSVFAETTDGEVGILPKHIPLVAPLAISVLRYVKNGQKQPVTVMGGLLRTNGEEISVLCNAAELAGEIDKARAEQAKVRAEARLREKTTEVNVTRAESALARSITRLKATQFTG